MSPKVAVIGLDGATFDVMQPWLAAGELPHIAALMARGVSGPLETVTPPITGPAWTSFATGVNPGKHSFYDFVICPGKFTTTWPRQ